MFKKNPKLRIFLAAYTLISGFNVYVLLDSKDGYQTLGTAILMYIMAAAATLILLIAAFFSDENKRVYLWSVCVVALPLVGLWLKDADFSKNNENEVQEVELRELKR